MIPVGFTYERPDTLDAALALLAEHGDDAKVLAGGHSLLPVMKLRLAAPELLIDIGRLGELRYSRVDGDHLAIGAGTRHHDLATSDVVAAEAPLLGAVARTVGDPQVRHRGTLGGSLAHADPASDLPAAVLALGGAIVMRGPRGERQVPVEEFFTGLFSTALEPDELVVEIRVPRTGRPQPRHPHHRHGQNARLPRDPGLHRPPHRRRRTIREIERCLKRGDRSGHPLRGRAHGRRSAGPGADLGGRFLRRWIGL